MPAVRVVNFSTVKVLADISETYGSQVKPGARAIVQFPDLNKEIETKVHFTSKYINPVNRTFQTEIRLKPGDIEYRANMIAVVKINDYTNPDAIVVPVSLIRETTDGKYIYVAQSASNELQAQRQPIETGKTYNGMTEVLKGLEVGDKVITTGYTSLVDGQLLKVNN
jgi:multidrug efflux pump subunit AcrA (membrane-fusion protein)